MHEQRKAAAAESFYRRERDPVWRPAITASDGVERDWRPASQDHYVAVDDIDEDALVLEVQAWPSVDRAGRLRFQGDGDELCCPTQDLYEAVCRGRTAGGQDAAVRPIRIGDVFWMRGLEPESGSFADVEILDVTRAGREAAKIAHYSAAAPTVDDEYARRMDLLGEETEPPPPPTGQSKTNVARPEI